MALLYLTVSYEEEFDYPGIRTANQGFKEFLSAQPDNKILKIAVNIR